MSQEEFNPNNAGPSQAPENNFTAGPGQTPVQPAGQIPATNQGQAQMNFVGPNPQAGAAGPQNPFPAGQLPNQAQTGNLTAGQTAAGGAPVPPMPAQGGPGLAGQAMNPAGPVAGWTQAGVPLAQPGPKKPKTKYIVWSIVGVLAVLILGVGGFLAYRHFSGDITGNYQASGLAKDLKSDLKESKLGDSGIALSEFSDGVSVETTIKDDKVKMSVSYSLDYDKFYQAIKSDLSSTYSTYKGDFTGDEWNYLMNTLIEKAGYDQDGFEDDVADSAEDQGFDYDEDSGQVTGLVFEGKVNRVKHTIEVTKVNEDSSLGGMEKGKTLSYKKTSSGLSLENEDGDTIDMAKD